MKVRHDPKGKYFTPVVRKTPVPAVIETLHGRIYGVVHVGPDHRLIDEMNSPEPFLAVTEARILSAEGEHRTAFLSLNKRHILWITPKEDWEADREGEDG